MKVCLEAGVSPGILSCVPQQRLAPSLQQREALLTTLPHPSLAQVTFIPIIPPKLPHDARLENLPLWISAAGNSAITVKYLPGSK